MLNKTLLLLLCLGLFLISSCISSPRIPPAPYGDFCVIRLNESSQAVDLRCVTPRDRLYTVQLQDAIGYQATDGEYASQLREYVLLLQSQLDECKRNQN